MVHKQLGATKNAICWKSSDKEPPKAARFRHLQIRSPNKWIYWLRRGSEIYRKSAVYACYFIVDLHFEILLRNQRGINNLAISALLSVLRLAIVHARLGVKDRYLCYYCAQTLSHSIHRLISTSLLWFLKPTCASLLLCPESEVQDLHDINIEKVKSSVKTARSLGVY